MVAQTRKRPVPVPDDLTRPFWEAAKDGKLVVQRCDACDYYNYPPRPLCDRCSSPNLQFQPVSGVGTVHSFTIMHQRNVAGFENDVPYTNVLVELDEQPLLIMLSNLPGVDDAMQIGRRVKVVFEELDDGMRLPQFRLME